MLKPYKGLIDRWWQLWNHRAPLYRELREHSTECIVVPFVSKHVLVATVPTSWVFTNKLCVMRLDSVDMHVAVLSNFFEAWARKHGGTMGQTTMTLSLSAGVKTFPLPLSVAGATTLLKQWNDGFAAVAKRVGSAFTTVLNTFNSQEEQGADVKKMREARTSIDAAVAVAFDWSDLKLEHGFHPTKQGERYTISESARGEVLQRLLKLNHERYAEEVKKGLHNKKGKSKKISTSKGRKGAAPAAPSLPGFGDDDEEG